MSAETVFIGIDPTAGGRLHTMAVLDARLKVVRLEKLGFESLLERVTSYASVLCGVDAPLAPSKALMADPAYRQRLGLDPKTASYSNYRVCEYELRRRKITLYNTPRMAEDAPRWMQEGWRIYEALRKAGFVEYSRPGARQMFETFPHGGFMTIIKRKPVSKSAVEGLLQRQLILYEEGVDVPDPMGVLEEWTRHKVLIGELSRQQLYDHDQLDALMAAYTASLANQQPDQVCSVGDPSEGQLILPVPELLDTY